MFLWPPLFLSWGPTSPPSARSSGTIRETSPLSLCPPTLPAIMFYCRSNPIKQVPWTRPWRFGSTSISSQPSPLLLAPVRRRRRRRRRGAQWARGAPEAPLGQQRVPRSDCVIGSPHGSAVWGLALGCNVDATLAAGGAAIYDNRLLHRRFPLHRGMPNRSSVERPVPDFVYNTTIYRETKTLGTHTCSLATRPIVTGTEVSCRPTRALGSSSHRPDGELPQSHDTIAGSSVVYYKRFE